MPDEVTTVGVVIAAYNAERFLPATLASIAGQDRQPDQVVVVDDGSQDSTADIVRSWSARLPIALVQHSSNQGPGAARRTAVEALWTDVAVVVDADDVCFPDHISSLVAQYGRAGGLVTANALRWVPGSCVEDRCTGDLWPIPSTNQLIGLLGSNYVLACCAFALRDYRRVGGYGVIRGFEDWDFALRMAAARVRITTTPSPTMLYRQHPASLSADHARLPQAVEVLEHFIDHCEDPRLLAVARRSLRTWRARLALHNAYQAARTGRASTARRAALGALAGPLPVMARAGAMLIAPRATVRFRDQERGRWSHLAGRR